METEAVDLYQIYDKAPDSIEYDSNLLGQNDTTKNNSASQSNASGPHGTSTQPEKSESSVAKLYKSFSFSNLINRFSGAFKIDFGTQTPNLVFIVPYRKREIQQKFFDRHMRQNVLSILNPKTYLIIYVHQRDKRPFNRGALKNIGFLWIRRKFPDTYHHMTLVMNDVDTMPLLANQWDYATTSGVVKHFYGFRHTLGGVFSIRAADFELTNGFPNYWSWGAEDNVLQLRCLKLGFTIDRSNYHQIMDKTVIHLQQGFVREIFPTESQRQLEDSKTGYTSNKEGWSDLSKITSQWDPETGFLHVNTFQTAFEAPPLEEKKKYDILHDLSKHKKKKKKAKAENKE